MNVEKILVEVRLYESGSLKAFANVTMPSEVGELTIKGFMVFQKDGKSPWVAFPNNKYTNKDGEEIKNQIIETSKAVKRKLEDLILAEYKRKTEEAPF